MKLFIWWFIDFPIKVKKRSVYSLLVDTVNIYIYIYIYIYVCVGVRVCMEFLSTFIAGPILDN